jgi:hypothetical protein
MIATLIIITLAFIWLLYETNFLTVQLPTGKIKEPKYARYKVYQVLKNRKPKFSDTVIYSGDNYPEDYSPNGEPEYQVIVSPGVDNVLCGFDWLNEHCADMVDYQPDVSMHIGGVRYSMKIKEPAVIKDIMKVNKLTKKYKVAHGIC